MKASRILTASILLPWCAGIALPVAAQGYPAKSIRLIIPFPPGGSNDIVGRMIGAQLGQRLGQQLVPDNRGGAGGVIGTEAAARAQPDGYTLLIVSIAYAYNPSLYKLSFDPVKSFTPVSLLGSGPNALAVHPSLPVKSTKELIALAKARPGQLLYASAGVGTFQHLGSELFRMMAGIKLVHVPFKGGGPAMNALISNEVQAMLIGYATTAGQVKAGKVRPLAIASAKRLAALPQVPTFAEAGFPDLQAAVPGNWWGMVAPKGTPAPIVHRLAAEIAKALADPAARKKYEDLGLTPVGSTPEEFAAGLPDQARKWRAVLQAMGKLAN